MWTHTSFMLLIFLNIFKSEKVTSIDNIKQSSLGQINPNIARSNEIFETFLKQLTDLLSMPDFQIKKLKKYCKILYKELRYSEYRIARKFGKHFKSLCRKYQDELIGELEFYRRELDKSTKLRVDFFSSINDAFTLQQRMQFNDYLYDLRDFGTDDKLTIKQETKKLINQVIIGSILKLNAKAQNDIARNLRKVFKEFSSRK